MEQAEMKKVLLPAMASLILPSSLLAGGYKIPEQSVNATALSAAYVANAHGPDAAYYNPAAMVFNEDRSLLEADLSLIHLTGIDFNGSAFGTSFKDETKKENFLIPTFHYTSPAVGKMRFGLSLVGPAGLTKRWKGTAEAAAEEFTLRSYEANPTIAFQLHESISVAAGFRVIYSDGAVKSSSSATAAVPIGRDMDGDSIDYGYNLALLVRPFDNLSLAATYRSKVWLTITGDADLEFPAVPALNYSGNLKVDVPIPASLNLAAAYTFNNNRTTAEIVFERTFWSAFNKLDFDYGVAFNAAPFAAFDAPGTKNWNNSDTYRLGITHQLNDKWTLMGGFAYDNTPIQKKYIGYELPDSDAIMFSVGAKHKYSDSLTIGGAFLYDRKKELKLDAGDQNINAGGIVGKFKDAAAYFLTIGIEYKF